MHALEVIVSRNAHAAGREAAHAALDKQVGTVTAISYANLEEPADLDRFFAAGWNRGMEE